MKKNYMLTLLINNKKFGDKNVVKDVYSPIDNKDKIGSGYFGK